jgi:hypothetical protein
MAQVEDEEEMKVSYMNGSHVERGGTQLSGDYLNHFDGNGEVNDIEEDHLDGNGIENLNENSPIGMLINDYLSRSQGNKA